MPNKDVTELKKEFDELYNTFCENESDEHIQTVLLIDGIRLIVSSLLKVVGLLVVILCLMVVFFVISMWGFTTLAKLFGFSLLAYVLIKAVKRDF